MYRAFPLLISTWLLTLFGASEASAWMPQNCAGENLFGGRELHLQMVAQAAQTQQENLALYDETTSDACKDPTGFYYLGARYYAPDSGEWLSPDPLGHAATMDLYSAFAGDPIDNFDADGRVATQVGHDTYLTGVGGYAVGQDIGSVFGLSQGSGLTFQNYDQAGIKGFENGGLFALGFASGGASNFVTIPGRIAFGSLVAGGGGVVSSGLQDYATGQPITVDGLYGGGVQSMYFGAAGATANEGIRAAVWSLDPFTRGNVLEQQYGANLPQTFPTIDNFNADTGVATSIKSIDLGAATYQNPSALTSKINGYVNSVAGFQGASLSGVSIEASQITARQLQIIIPSGITSAQQAAINASVARAKGLGVNVITSQF